MAQTSRSGLTRRKLAIFLIIALLPMVIGTTLAVYDVLRQGPPDSSLASRQP